MTISVWQELAEPPRRAEHDVVVVGAGMVGCYAARLLVEAGRDVALVEAREVGAGASGRNAGFILTGLRHHYHEAVARFGPRAREIWRLTVENRARMVAACRELGVDHRATGADLLALDVVERRDL